MVCIYIPHWRGNLRSHDAGFYVESDLGPRRNMERKSIFSVKRLFLVMVMAIFFLSACTRQKGITVRDAWIRATKAGENGAVYFVLQNDSTEQDELIEASSDLADAVEIHESSMVTGTDVMQMNQYPLWLWIQAQKSLLSPVDCM